MAEKNNKVQQNIINNEHHENTVIHKNYDSEMITFYKSILFFEINFLFLKNNYIEWIFSLLINKICNEWDWNRS